MFVGHYGAALALKKTNSRMNLGWIFLISMLPDMLLGIFVLLGIEKVYIPNDFLKLHYLLFDFPYSHGFTSTIIWMITISILVKFLLPKYISNKNKVALTLSLAFFSHFILDAIVHIPEIPVLGSNSYKIGFSLWNMYPIALALEIIITIIGLVIYLREKRSLKSRIGISIIIVLLTIFTVAQALSPMPTKEFINMIAIQWIVSGILISSFAFWLDYDKEEVK